MRNEQENAAVFEYSLTSHIITFGVAFLFVSFLGLYSFTVLPDGPYAGVLFLMVGLLSLYNSGHDWLQRARKALFYHQNASVIGRNFEKEMRYDDIEKVSKRKTWLGGVNLSFFVKGEGKPLVLFWNPVNKELKTDLYSWLLRKTQQSLVNRS